MVGSREVEIRKRCARIRDGGGEGLWSTNGTYCPHFCGAPGVGL